MKRVVLFVISTIISALLPLYASAAPLSQSLELRSGFTVTNVTPIVSAFDGFTGSEYYALKPFTGHPGGSTLSAQFVASNSGAVNEIGILDGSSFVQLIGMNSPLGTSATRTQGETETFKLGHKTTFSTNAVRIYSSVDNENLLSAPHVIAKIINKSGNVTIASANMAAQSYTFPVEAGDIVVFLEDVIVPYSDKDWNDFTVVLRQTANIPPTVSISASDGTSDEFVLLNLTKDSRLGACDIYRSQNQNSRGDLIVSSLLVDSYEDRGATPGVTYYYTAVCRGNGGGNQINSPADPGYRLAANNDCDGDGVSDAQELLDGTAVCDPGSFKTHLKSPVFTKYNTFLSQWNFLELISAGTSTLNVSISAYRIDGQQIGAPIALSLAPGQQFDVNIHDFVGEIDTYGLVRVDFNDKDPGAELLGRMTMYRPDKSGDTFSFAFARELRNATKGSTFALANTFDPQGQGYLVPVWSEVTNVDSVERSFIYRVYSQDGKLLSEKNIAIQAQGQFDVQAGHEFGEGVYLNEIIPLEGNAPYLSALSRYSSNHASGAEAESYNFAFSTDARAGAGDAQFMAISNQFGECWSQANWIEVGNVQDAPIEAKLIFRDESGIELGQTTATIEGKSQVHFNGSALLASGKRGSAKISSDVAGSLVAQSVVYYHDCKDNKTQSAYVSQGRIGMDLRQSGTFNTFLGMKNLLTIINTSADSFQTKVQAHGSANANATIQNDITGQQTVSTNIGENETLNTPANDYGTLSIETPAGKKVVAENIRIRQINGKIDFAMSTAIQ